MNNTTPISKIMTRKPVTVSPLDNLDTVHRVFEEHGFHHIPVVENNKLIGIVTYNDYLKVVRNLFNNKFEEQNNERLLNAMLAKDVMTENLMCLAPFDTVEDALRIFKTNHFHAVPVVEGDRQLVGILSTYDLIKMLERMLAPEVDYAEE